MSLLLRSFALGVVLSLVSTMARADDVRRGDAIPEGYHVERSGPGETVLATGAVIFAVSYGAMLGIGIGVGALCGALRCDDASPLLWTLVPVAGPLKLTQGSDGGKFVDIIRADAVLQGAGLGMVAVGGLMYLAGPERLVRNKTLGASMHVEPLFAGGTTGLAVGGTF